MSDKKTSSVIDDILINENKDHLTIIHGKSFRKGPILTALLFLLLGCLIVYNISVEYNPYGNKSYVFYLFLAAGSFFILAGGFVFFSKTGVDIDLEKKRIRNFVKFFFKSGSWQNFDKYPFITVIKMNKRTRYGGGFGGNFRFMGATGPSVVLDNDEYEICLLNKTHYKRITLDVSTDHKKAMHKMYLLAEKLKLQPVVFKPYKISDSMKSILKNNKLFGPK